MKDMRNIFLNQNVDQITLCKLVCVIKIELCQIAATVFSDAALTETKMLLRARRVDEAKTQMSILQKQHQRTLH